jgi:type II secretory pathway component GspD/PulD (secretin)
VNRRVVRTGPRIVLLAMAILANSPTLADELAIIELHHRRADDVIPIVQPFLEAGGVLTGADDKLFVRSSPANLAQIREAVAAIDRPQRQLLITVGQGNAAARDGTSLRGSATIGSGDVQVGVNRPPAGESGATVITRSRSVQTDQQNTSSVRALEGTEAYISVGQSVPITSTTVTTGRYPPLAQQSTSYRDVTSGFYATARVSGDLVTLEISSRQQAYRPRDETIDTRGVTSVVTGRLGEWIELGAVRESQSGSGSGLLVWGRHTGSSEYSASVKVDEIR